jgi:hypothetical protein
MRSEDFYKPTDADLLQMENELLVFEVQYLKARLAEAKRQAGANNRGAGRVANAGWVKKLLVDAKPHMKRLLKKMPAPVARRMNRFKPLYKEFERKYLK